MHRHRPVKTITRAYLGPIYGALRPDPRAHGNVYVTDLCACGAIRETNRNQGFAETSGWLRARDEER